jgi:hypothetical protein
MTPPNHAHGVNRHKIRDLPAKWYEGTKRQDTNCHNTQKANRKTVFEALQYPWHFNEEVGEFSFLGRRAPLHVVFEHVCEQRGRNVKRKAAEEDGEHKDPFEVLEERGEEGVGSEAVAQDSEGDVSEACEDNHDGEPVDGVSKIASYEKTMEEHDLPNFPGIDVVLVNISIVPPNRKVVCSRHDPSSANRVVRANVGDNGDFTREANIREQELAEKRRKRTSYEPESEGVKEQFVAAVCVLLPTR